MCQDDVDDVSGEYEKSSTLEMKHKVEINETHAGGVAKLKDYLKSNISQVNTKDHVLVSSGRKKEKRRCTTCCYWMISSCLLISATIIAVLIGSMWQSVADLRFLEMHFIALFLQFCFLNWFLSMTEAIFETTLQKHFISKNQNYRPVYLYLRLILLISLKSNLNRFHEKQYMMWKNLLYKRRYMRYKKNTLLSMF